MAETENQQSTQDNAGGGSQPPARPEHIPEQFWDATKGVANVDALGKSYGELRAKLGQGRDAVRAEVEAERFKARPPAADKYEFKVPEKGAPEGLVILTEAPGADFKPEAGKSYFQINPKDPLLGFWREHAWKNGLSNDDFMAGVMAFAGAQAQRVPTAEDIEAERAGTYKELGENGKARYEHARGKLVGLLGEEAAGLIWPADAIPSAKGVEAVESLLEKAGEPKFSAGDSGAAPGDRTAIQARIDELQAKPNYDIDPAIQRELAGLYKKLHPGEIGIGTPYIGGSAAAS